MKAKLRARASRAHAAALPERTNNLLDRALELGALPASTQSLLALTRRDDAEVGPVVDALALNPNLSAAMLRAANSAAYGQARQVADLRRAVTVVGMQEVHDLVAGTAMMAAFSRPHPSAERLQATSVLSGSIAQKLTIKLRAGSGSTAYLSGLMCELGALACIALDPEYPALYEQYVPDPRRRFEEELARYGASTPMIGARILTMSMLPSVVSQAVGTTGFEDEGEPSELGRIVAFARLAAPVMVRAVEHGDAQVLQDELAATAELVALDGLAPERLFRTCLAAATQAELTLRGELGLKQSAPMNDVYPTTSQTALKRKNARRERMLIGLALVAVGFGALLIWWLRG